MGDDDGSGDAGEWVLQEYVSKYQAEFSSISNGGLLSGAAAKPVMSATGLPTASLRKIWELADIDKDHHLDMEEFVVAKFLADMAIQQRPIPDSLPMEMIPYSKR